MHFLLVTSFIVGVNFSTFDFGDKPLGVTFPLDGNWSLNGQFDVCP